ncbi:MAG: endonuclease/exonuclease/phosphatase family protein [Planctomycetota bacterium]
MGRRRSRSKKANRSTLFSRLVTAVWISVGCGGLALWAGADLPVVGPLVQCVLPGESRSQEREPAAEQEPTDQLMDAGEGGGRDAGGSSSVTPASARAEPNANSREAGDAASGTITIASFNIQVFGESKLSKPWVVEILARIVRRFDVTAIQEIRCKEDYVIPEFVDAVNADGSAYNYVVGPRLGRTISKEQYAFVYDTERIQVDMTSSGTIQDPKDYLHRDPFVTRFRTRTPNPSQSFTFWLVNVHTDPDEVATEVRALADVFLVMQQARANEDDVILLGDFNANSQQFGLLGRVPGIMWVVRDTTTNTRRRKTYDNILFDRVRTAEYTGRWGVYEFENIHQLTREQALAVSDHLPVWAEFDSREAPAGNAALLPPAHMTR